jgi:hypothetical protein
MNKEEIKSIQDIVIIQTDKDGKLVIINKNDCFNKIAEK